MSQLAPVNHLSDDESFPVHVGGSSSAAVSAGVSDRTDNDKVKLVKEESCRSGSKRKPETRILTYIQKHQMKMQVQKLVAQRCSCRGGKCFQALAGQVQQLLEIQIQKYQLDKRDADNLAMHSENLNGSVFSESCLFNSSPG